MSGNISAAGGDGTILAIFSHKDTFDEQQTEYGDVCRLITECSSSKESLRRLYDMFKSHVYAVAYSITADHHLAEDCVSETFIRLAQVKRFDPSKGDGKGFILTIARNVAMELLRRYKRRKPDIIIQSYGDAEQTVEDSIFINQLLKELNSKQRQIVVMKCCAGLSFREIARIMRSPESTVKSRYQKAMTILKKKAGENI